MELGGFQTGGQGLIRKGGYTGYNGGAFLHSIALWTDLGYSQWYTGQWAHHLA